MTQHISETRNTLRVIRYPELYKRIPVCRATLWRWEREGAFPKSIPLGKNSKGWIESEIDEWLNNRQSEVA